MVTGEENGLAGGLERCPVAADDAVVGDDGLEDAGFVVCPVAMLWLKDDVAALVGNEVFVVWWNQQIVALAESSRAAIVSEVKFPAFVF